MLLANSRNHATDTVLDSYSDQAVGHDQENHQQNRCNGAAVKASHLVLKLMSCLYCLLTGLAGGSTPLQAGNTSNCRQAASNREMVSALRWIDESIKFCHLAG
jgi:hypothetical protein